MNAANLPYSVNFANDENGEKFPKVRISVMIKNGQKVFLIKKFINNKDIFMLPGEFLSWGETLEVGARRACIETTGVDVKIGSLLGISDRISPTDDIHIIDVIFTGEFLDNLPVGDEFVYMSNEEINNNEVYPFKILNINIDGSKYLGNDWE